VIHFKHFRQQWPVGHGFFHSASLQFEKETYRYVYDCGAGSLKIIENQIDLYAGNLSLEGQNHEIDMVVVSHFHADHIKGLPYLLKNFTVRKLVIPHLSEDFKLAALASLAADGIQSWTLFSELVADPRAWLADRGFNGEIIEVATFGDFLDILSPMPPSGDGLSLPSGLFNHRNVGTIYSHNTALWFFKFYVHESYETYLKLLCALCFVFESDGYDELELLLRDPAWISANQKRLKHAFLLLGSGKQNVLSLCMYSGPEKNRKRHADFSWSPSSYFPSNNYSYYRRGQLGWLATGDAELKSAAAIGGFEKHYSHYLRNIDTVTIPHHGSRDNYNPRLGDIGFRHIITSNHIKDPKGNHPATEVMLNLNIKSHFTHVVTADGASHLFDRIYGWLDL